MATDDAETIRLRAETCQLIVANCIAGRTSLNSLVDDLRTQAGLSPEEARTYIEQVEQHFAARQSNPDQRRQDDEGEGRAATPLGLSEEAATEYRERRQRDSEAARRRADELRQKALDDAAWGILKAKMASIQHPTRPDSAMSAQDIATLFGITKPSSSAELPQSVLDAAPHLAKLLETSGDAHIDKTWELRNLYASESVTKTMLNLMQKRHLEEPIPRSIWREIILDGYVDFEKLYASMDPGYNHQDDPKEFAGEFALIRKDHSSARKSLLYEAEWIRVFGAWEAGLLEVYPHRASELRGYRKIVTEVFRAVPNKPIIAVRFDVDVRERYSKNPFHLDDRNRINLPLVAQLFQSSEPVKRAATSSSSPSKRAAVVCQNWNANRCTDPCSGGRKHGFCSQCGGKHRAIDHEPCAASFEAGRRKGNVDGNRAGGSGPGRA